MSTQDIIQQLEQAQREAAENTAIEEISQSELDQISGAGPNGPAGLVWKKRY